MVRLSVNFKSRIPKTGTAEQEEYTPGVLLEIVWWKEIIPHVQPGSVRAREKFCSLALVFVLCMRCIALVLCHVVVNTAVYGLAHGMEKHTKENHFDATVAHPAP